MILRPNTAHLLTLALALSSAATLACSESDDANGTSSTTTASTLAQCRFENFSVEITEGPHRGTSIAGPLWVTEELETGRLFGVLERADEPIMFTGRYAPNAKIAVELALSDGVVVGQGSVTGDLCSGQATIEGIALGPEVARDFAVSGTDLGHWLLATPQTFDGGAVQVYTTGTSGTETTSAIKVISRFKCTNCGGTISDGKCTTNDSQAKMCIDGNSSNVPDTLGSLLQLIGFLAT